MTTPTALREKLRLICDSDHPASPWARNVVQCMDDLQKWPDSRELMRALGYAVAMFERKMLDPSGRQKSPLTPDEIAAIFGLGGDGSSHQ